LTAMRQALCAFSLVVLGLSGRLCAGEPGAPLVTAGPLAQRIVLDGLLDEPAWADAGVIPALIQQEPAPGRPTPFSTRVLILADAETLYLGIVCTDPEPARISVHTLERDADLSADDTVALVLDTFHDRRTG